MVSRVQNFLPCPRYSLQERKSRIMEISTRCLQPLFLPLHGFRIHTRSRVSRGMETQFVRTLGLRSEFALVRYQYGNGVCLFEGHRVKAAQSFGNGPDCPIQLVHFSDRPSIRRMVRLGCANDSASTIAILLSNAPFEACEYCWPELLF